MPMLKEEVQIGSQEMEMMVLGCMLNNQEHLNVAKSAIKEDDFEDKKHRIIFQAIVTRNVPEIVSVAEQLKNDGNHQAVGGLQYLTSLSQYAGTGARIEAYCEDLRRQSLKRALLCAQRGLVDDLEKGVDPHAALERLRTKIENIKAEKPHADSLYSHLLVPATEKEISEEIRNISPGARVNMQLGEVDLILPGGALTIIAGPTGHGKTLVSINMVLNYLSLHPDKKAWFFSYEESRAAILSLFLNTYVDDIISENNRRTIKSCFRDGHLQYVQEEKRANYLKKKEEFFKTLIENGRLNIFYCDYSIEELDRAIRFIKNKSDAGIVAIDYMQLLRQSMTKTTQRHEELKQVCQIAKDCAVDTGLPVVVAAQFNRSVVNEATMSKFAIGEAGDIERSANTIIALWNRNENESSDVANKGRNGKPISKESAIYIELLKSREEGIGQSAVFNLNGKTGKLTSRSPSRKF